MLNNGDLVRFRNNQFKIGVNQTDYYGVILDYQLGNSWTPASYKIFCFYDNPKIAWLPTYTIIEVIQGHTATLLCEVGGYTNLAT